MKKIRDFNAFDDDKAQGYLAQSLPKGRTTTNSYDKDRN